MHVSHRQLQSFIHVAQSATFAEAAEKMHLSQPALSSSIKKLESQLGGRLFSRSTRKVQLSPEGQEFLPIAIRLLNDWDSALTDINNLFAMQRGKLSIAAMPSFAAGRLPQILGEFNSAWPNINLSVLDVVMEDVIQLVREGRVELGFTFENEQLEGLDFVPLINDQFIAVVPRDHQLADQKEITLGDLLSNQFVAMNRGSSIRSWIDEYAHQQGVELDIVIEAGQLSTVGEFVRQGLGVSLVPGICRSQMTNKGLNCIEVSDPNLCRKLGIIRSGRKHLSVPAEALWEMVTDKKNGS